MSSSVGIQGLRAARQDNRCKLRREQRRAIGDCMRRTVAAVCGFLALTLCAPLAQAQVSFVPSHNLVVGEKPAATAVGDVNGDGKSDLVTANYGSGNVSVLLNDGMGGFGEASSFNVGTYPMAVTLGDFNGDGKLDIAALSWWPGTVSVLFGDGAGGFGPKANFGHWSHGTSLAAGDFNGDGKTDLAVVDSVSTSVSVLLANGSGGFSAQTSFNAEANPTDVVVGDFNGDGKSDLVVASEDYPWGHVSLLMGDGSGSFGAPATFGIYSAYAEIAVGDFNGDGRSDLAVAEGPSGYSITLSSGDVILSPDSCSVLVFPGKGSGGFGTPTWYEPVRSAASVSVGDFDGDGRSDLALDCSYSMSVLLGDGSGGFGPGTDFGVGYLIGAVGVGDFNGDGKSDLTLADHDSGYVSMLLNRTVASPSAPAVVSASAVYPASLLVTFSETMGTAALDPSRYTLSGPSQGSLLPNPSSIEAVDATNMRLIWNTGTFGSAGQVTITVDAGVTDSSGQVISNPRSANAMVTVIPLVSFDPGADLNAGNDQRAAAVGDFNGDGKSDVAVANNNSDVVSVLLSDGSGGFGTATQFGVGDGPWSVAVADFNGDGESDLVTANTRSSNLSVLLGNGSGGFGTARNFFVSYNPTFVAVADLNGDGKSDLVAADYYTTNVSVLLGDGAGGFGTPHRFAVGRGIPFSIAVGDLNGDGNPDLLAAEGYYGAMVLLGDGSGGLGKATNLAVGGNVWSTATGDFNGDGKTDLVTANDDSPGDVSIFLGDGSGGFGLPTNFDTGASPKSVAVGDFNADGKSDLAVASSGASDVSVLLGTGSGSFSLPARFGVGYHPESVLVGDFNGDGKSDLAAGNGMTYASVLLNVTGREAPAAPVVLGLDYFSDTGISTTDCITRDSMPIVVGTGEPRTSVTVYLGGTIVGTGTADGSGKWSVPVTTLSEGTHTLTATVRNAAGKESPASKGLFVTIDTVGATVTMGAVSPSPRNTPVSSVSITFSSPVYSFELTDLGLTRDGVPVPRSGEVLHGSGTNWTLDNLTAITSPAGAYELSLDAFSCVDAAGNPLVASAKVAWVMETHADLALSKSVYPHAAHSGELVTYTLEITNAGPTDTENATLTDPLPPNVEFVAESVPASNVDGTTRTWNLGAMAVGDTTTVTLQVRVLESAVITNTAGVVHDRYDPNPNNNVSSATLAVGPGADLAVAVTSDPAPPMLGQPLHYVLDVTNQGPDTAENVVVSDVIPANTVLSSAEVSQGNVDLSGGHVAGDLGSIAREATATMTVTVIPQQTGEIVNSAGVTSSIFDRYTSNNVATTTLSAIQRSGPDLIADSMTASLSKRGPVKMTIRTRVLNRGNVTSGRTSVLYYLSEKDHLDAPARQIGSGNVTSLKPGRSQQLSSSVRIDRPATAVYVIAVIDPTKRVDEGNELNNVRVFGPLQ